MDGQVIHLYHEDGVEICKPNLPTLNSESLITDFVGPRSSILFGVSIGLFKTQGLASAAGIQISVEFTQKLYST